MNLKIHVVRSLGVGLYSDTNDRNVSINERGNGTFLKSTCVTQHHQMRHKSHTKVLCKWQIKEE